MQPQPDPLHEAIEQLYYSNTTKRQAAVKQLIAIGEPAIPALMDTLTIANAWVIQKRLPVEERATADPKQRDEWARESAAEALRAIGKPAMEPLLQALKHDSVKVRAAAASALKTINDPAVTEALRQLLYHEINVSRKEYKKWLLSKLRRIVYAAILAFVFWINTSISDMAKGFTTGIIFVGIWAGFADSRANIRRNAIEAFSNAADTRIVGTLAICLSDKDNEVRQAAAAALKKLLPEVQASDKQYITEAEMRALIEALGRSSDKQLVIAILKAFEQIGDERAIAEVQWLAIHGIDSVLEAAQACLPYLQIQVKKAKQAQELLRPSNSVSATAPNTLLRPAQGGTTTTEETQLLRPSG